MMEQHPDMPHYSPFRWGLNPAPMAAGTPADAPRWFILAIAGMPTGPMYFWFDEDALKTLRSTITERLSGLTLPQSVGVPPSGEVIDWSKRVKKSE